MIFSALSCSQKEYNKATREVIFDICFRSRGHSRSCALNWNEHGYAIKTTRHSFFDNETVLDMTLRSIENQWLVSEKRLKNTSSWWVVHLNLRYVMWHWSTDTFFDSCQKRYPLTSVTWHIAGSSVQLIKMTCFLNVFRWPVIGFQLIVGSCPKLSHCQRNCVLWFWSHSHVRFSSVRTTLNDLLSGSRCRKLLPVLLYCIPFENTITLKISYDK